MHHFNGDFQNETMDAIELKEPRMYKVLLLNDDYSSMEFVIKVLMQIFHHSFEKANEIMFNVHEQGKGLCGVYVYEIAETKVAHVRKMAKEEQFPLRAIMEAE
ncbi:MULTISPECIES: ATP-dependent Clp protease adaptor ClpS [Sulfurospirillum]|uniref:ATP-dependent Clp protease adapter protein ClpS n=3 Tax=Sulfurospirillum TaxID=57665 RepID=A0A1D7TLA0_9BACT|nr:MULTISPECIES: ATP-dependent Clp protease adaptor ClpS [Sulfurospirillum]AHJ13519.1 ATP-dependent Clp protease adaptor protein ClpS [Sulfurospirillum multivorans DSM 12446]AOO65779.1 ATP-dependent Clp protease adaptor protein ClpS [Sulfurospirillum halorespirans DSM 13726]QEH07009.1 ATP-dependent Clp protease adaptor protein ClpS [Sulfurospirillum multivorans]